MAYVFDKNLTRVENYGYNDRDIGIIVLVPFFSQRVLVPEVTKRELNIFQRAVLNFFQIACYAPEQISDFLLLDVKLVEKIISELQADMYLDDKRHITQKGINILESERDMEINPGRFNLFYFYNYSKIKMSKKQVYSATLPNRVNKPTIKP